jgi:3-oxoacyl-[acyl-carrier protein] reductase
MFDLSGKNALVTGAGRGIGAGIAQALAEHGASVVVNDLDADRAEEVACAITADGGHATPSVFDVTDLAAVATATARLDAIDVLINNAGNAGAYSMLPQPFHEMDPAEWAAPIMVNLYGVLNCSKAVLGGMLERGWGRIVTISSGAATGGLAIGVAPYAAGKGGGIAFTRTLALEVAARGITANSLAIGLMEVPDETYTARLAARIPVRRPGTPRDVGAACVWLASPEASWVTGQTIQVNGGAITT